MILIADYGMGNLRSVEKALQFQGMETVISKDPDAVSMAEGVILPGVGAFPDAMDNLEKSGMGQAICAAAAAGKPVLGICLGMQLLFGQGYEVEKRQGLGLLKGSVVRLPDRLKIPHMGWNSVDIIKDHPLVRDIKTGDYMYFVHSYYAEGVDNNDLVACCDYSVSIPSVVCSGNVMGTQFHPEKSGHNGLIIYRNFKGLIL